MYPNSFRPCFRVFALTAALSASLSACLVRAPLASDDLPETDAAPIDAPMDAPNIDAPSRDVPSIPPPDVGRDAPSSDAGVPDGFCWYGVPCCPEERNRTGEFGSFNLTYPTAVLTTITGPVSAPDAGMPGPFAATWQGTRVHDTSVENGDCLDSNVPAPPATSCTSSTVIRVAESAGGEIREYLIGKPSALFDSITPGTPVRVLRDTSSAPARDTLEIVRESDEVPLLIIRTVKAPAESLRSEFPLQLGAVVLSEGPPHCENRPLSSCPRIFRMATLHVSAPGLERDLGPSESVDVATPQGRYRVTHRTFIYRGSSAPPIPECADRSSAPYSFELVRLGD